MNTYLNFKINFLLFLTIGLLMTSIFMGVGCQGEKFEINAGLLETPLSNIPSLLDRPEKIQYGAEWDLVQNIYGRNAEVIRYNAKDHAAYLTLAEVYLNEARITGEHGHYYPAALAMTDKVLSGRNLDKDMIFQAKALQASALLSQHEFVAAEKVAEEAILLNPYNAQIFGALVDAQVELGKYKEAIQSADRMISIRPDLRSYSRVSYLRELHGDISGAISAMEQAIQSGYPGNEETAWAQLTYGNLLMRYGKTAAAERVFESILTQREDYPFAIAALASVKMEQQAEQAAEELLNQSRSIIPEVGFYIDLANIYKKQGRTNEFMKTIAEIKIMLQEDVDSGHNMNLEYADLYLNTLASPEQAMWYAQKEYEKRPANIHVNKILSQIYLAKKDYEKSAAHMVKAQITNAQDPDLLNLQETLSSAGYALN